MELRSAAQAPMRPGPLSGRTFREPGQGVASVYRHLLLRDLGAEICRERRALRLGREFETAASLHPDLEWAHSGAMALTGLPSEAPLLAPGPLASCARGAADAFTELAGDRFTADLDGAALLGERAALLGLERRGSVSPGGSCRLLPAADGWLAVNLAREEDLRSLPAWLGEGDTEDPWAFAAERLASASVEGAVERARLLELPVASLAPPAAEPRAWLRAASCGETRSRNQRDPPLVVDLSALWAGPLCAQLLAVAGARVVKVESARRPDGARRGQPAFFDLMNAGKASVALDFTSKVDRKVLISLLESADIIIESARPRALFQLGIDAEQCVASRPGLTWVSITGYGRSEPEANWVAFGDDAGVAAGLAAVPDSGADSGPYFCGDAIADPLTGIHAALAALAFHAAGGGALLDVSLRGVVAHALAFRAGDIALCGTAEVRRVPGGGAGAFEVVAGSERKAVAAPRARASRGVAATLGADTARVLKEFRISC